METKEIRRANLLDLAASYKSTIQFCERVGMSPTYFSQIKTKRKAMGDDLSRRIEQHLGLPRGYMDTLKTEGRSSSQIPVETLGVAYALESLSPSIRENLSRLIYMLATEESENRELRSAMVAPFNIRIGEPSDGEVSEAPAKKAAAG